MIIIIGKLFLLVCIKTNMDKLLELQNKMKLVVDNKMIYTIVSLFFCLYGAAIAPKPPGFVSVVFENTFGKIILICIASFFINTDFRLALIVSVCLVLGTNIVANRPIFESFGVIDNNYKAQTKGRLLDVKTNLHAGCLNIKMADLLAAFQGDAPKLQTTLKYGFAELLKKQTSTDARERLLRTAYVAGLPYNVKFTDEQAPYIASILIQWGYDLGGECRLTTGKSTFSLV